jgi:hypothetical protein
MAKRSTAARACQFIQLYVRLLETDDNGYGYCKSCGKMLTWQESNGGHFQPKGRNYNAAAFEEDNVHLQCETCNCYRGGNPAGYYEYMLKTYGKKAIAEIKQLSYKTLDNTEIREIAKLYKQKCKDLAPKKNFKVNIPS